MHVRSGKDGSLAAPFEARKSGESVLIMLCCECAQTVERSWSKADAISKRNGKDINLVRWQQLQEAVEDRWQQVQEAVKDRIDAATGGICTFAPGAWAQAAPLLWTSMIS
eukprot:1157345-Pelagomonas_calceolata.AAC.19